MYKPLKMLVALAGVALAGQAAAQITLYAGEGFHGPAFTATRDVWNLDSSGFNDRASSIIVERGRWEVCEHARFEGRCVVLRPGQYWTLRDMGLENQISSLRHVGGRPAGYEVAPPPPPPTPVYEYRQRPGERLFEVPVDSVRAVVGPPEQRCWVERQEVQGGSQANVPGAVVGGIIGGILGHQIGAGRGNTAATIGGAVAGAAVGANVPGGGSGGYTRDVQRCTSAPSGPPQYWDVTYNFHGQWHHAQLSAPPGPTIWVNDRGEPRG